MRRLALLAAAVLAVIAAPSARAEPYDVDLTRLGPPDPTVWSSVTQLATGTPVGQAQAKTLAAQSRQRFATLSSNLALALSSAVLQTAATTGYSGFAVDLEVAYAPVDADPVGTTGSVTPYGFVNTVWPTASSLPTALLIPSIHVRKALPYSLEVGGRLMWVNSSNYYAAQAEAKWAIHEGFEYVPDVAVRGAFTRLLGVKDWNLTTTDLDFIVSMRFAVKGVVSLTPYVSARFTLLNASTERMDFAPCRNAGGATCTLPSTPQDALSTTAAFPAFSASLYRTTLGVRFTTYALALAIEGTYFGGATPSSDDYKDVTLRSSFSGAAKLGWEF